MRFTMKNFLLGTALVVGLLGTGAAANAQAREFHGGERAPVTRGSDRGFDRGSDRGSGRGFDRGYARGYERPVVRGYGYGGGYGVAYAAPYAAGYIPPYPGDGYVWLNGAWVFRGRPGFAVGYGRGFDRGYGRGFDRGGRGSEGGRGFERGRR